MTLPPLRLRKDEDRRLRAGHLWVFSNEVDVDATPLTAFEPGDTVEVQDARGAPLGVGYVNPRSLIAVRMVSRDRLVVDRFGDRLVVQITTAGMERVRDEIVEALRDELAPTGILLRNDVGGRELEGLPSYVETAWGEIPDALPLEENGVRFEAPVAGQKTGWFFDHRMNRARLGAYVRGGRVLDVFSYVGGWGVQAAAAGADQVVCVDASAPALEMVARNAALNGVEDRVSSIRGDAFDVLRQLAADGERFDTVVLDPPAFVKRKKDIKQGEEAYRRLNTLALDVLKQDGILVSASCSYHLPRSALQDAVLRAGRRQGRSLQVVEQGHQGPDHPVHPAIPETSYLKAFFVRVG